jgi:hypothetical protein
VPLTDNKEQDGSLVETSIRESRLGNQKTAPKGQNWNAFRLAILQAGSKEVQKFC